jgi:hypothetical protein
MANRSITSRIDRLEKTAVRLPVKHEPRDPEWARFIATDPDVDPLWDKIAPLRESSPAWYGVLLEMRTIFERKRDGGTLFPESPAPAT